MQYYKNYINLEEYTTKNDLENNIIINGILNKIDEDYIIEIKDKDNLIIINNRAIVGDDVYINILNNEIINIKNRNLNYIVGILDITSNIKYGFYNDKMLYLFHPTNKKITNFYIPYSLKNQSKDKIVNKKLYIVIQFKEWKITDKLPIGTLIDIIGNVGDIDSEYEHLRYFFNIKNNTYKIDNDKRVNDIKIIEDIQVKTPDYEVFSIDPIGSTDIDDAFHYIDIDNDYYQFGIHIASPFIFFREDIEKVLDRISTVYLPNKKYNMLPNMYADNIISLLENKNRFSISVILIINKQTNEINNISIEHTIIKNIKNYDYDSFDILYKNLFKKKRLTDIEKNIVNCMKYSAQFFNINSLEIFDSHLLVESWMIKANKIIAKYLIDLKLTNLIVRTNKKTNYIKEFYKDIEERDNELIKYLLLKQENSALYEIYNNINRDIINNDDNKQTHYKLGDEHYTHFTSPIRRAVDLFIHGLIINKKDLLENEILQTYIDKINIFNKNNRRFTRNIKRLEFLNNIKLSGQSGNIITNCYIIKIDNYKLKIYIPEYNLEESIIIIPYKFKDICRSNIELDDNKIIKSIEYSFYHNDNDNNNNEILKKYTLYQSLKIKLWIFMSFDNIFDKLKLEIID
jgi:exoribonuclease R